MRLLPDTQMVRATHANKAIHSETGVSLRRSTYTAPTGLKQMILLAKKSYAPTITPC